MGSLFGRARFSADIKPSLASPDLHWLPVCGKTRVSFMVGKGGRVASIQYEEKQRLAKAPAATLAPFCTLPSSGKMLLTSCGAHMSQPRLCLFTRSCCYCIEAFPFRLDPVASLPDIGYAMSPDGPRTSGRIRHVVPSTSSLQRDVW